MFIKHFRFSGDVVVFNEGGVAADVNVFDALSSFPRMRTISSALLDFVAEVFNAGPSHQPVKDALLRRLAALGVCELGVFEAPFLRDEAVLHFLFGHYENADGQRRRMELYKGHALSGQFLTKLVEVRVAFYYSTDSSVEAASTQFLSFVS